MSLGNHMRDAIEGLDTSNATPINVGRYETPRVQVYIDGKRMVTVGISEPPNLNGETSHTFLLVSRLRQGYGYARVLAKRLTSIPHACLLRKDGEGRETVELLSFDRCKENGHGPLKVHFRTTGITQWYRQTV